MFYASYESRTAWAVCNISGDIAFRPSARAAGTWSQFECHMHPPF